MYYSLDTAVRSRRINRNRNLTSYTATSRLGPVSTTLLLAMIVAVLALLYLTQVTKTSVYGYQVSTLDSQRQDLTEAQQQLEIEAARLQSVANISKRPVVGSLTPETNPTFINP